MQANDSGVSKSLWALIAFVSVLSIAISSATGVGISGPQVAGLFAVIGICLGVSAFYTLRRPDERLARMMRGMAELFLLVFMVGALSYNGASLDHPLWDRTFQSWDEAIGFDWRSWLSVVDAHPQIHQVLVVAYQSMLPQTVAAIVALVTVRAYGHLDTYLLAYGIAALATVAIAAAMPALGPLIELAITPADHPNVVLAIPREVSDQALALREGTMKITDLSGAQGLVSFPSFHTVSAILLLLAFAAVPYLRWVGLVLNLVMLVAIPIEGGHYLVDVLAGATLAPACWILAARLIRSERSGAAAARGAPVQPHPIIASLLPQER